METYTQEYTIHVCAQMILDHLEIANERGEKFSAEMVAHLASVIVTNCSTESSKKEVDGLFSL